MPRVPVDLTGGVKLHDLLKVDDDSSVVTLVPMTTNDKFIVTCAQAALRDAGVHDGMSLVEVQVDKGDGSGQRRVIKPSEVGGFIRRIHTYLDIDIFFVFLCNFV